MPIRNIQIKVQRAFLNCYVLNSKLVNNISQCLGQKTGFIACTIVLILILIIIITNIKSVLSAIDIYTFI